MNGYKCVWAHLSLYYFISLSLFLSLSFSLYVRLPQKSTDLTDMSCYPIEWCLNLSGGIRSTLLPSSDEIPIFQLDLQYPCQTNIDPRLNYATLWNHRTLQNVRVKENEQEKKNKQVKLITFPQRMLSLFGYLSISLNSRYIYIYIYVHVCINRVDKEEFIDF